MNKPARFRAALLAGLSELRDDPQKLSIFVERGHLRATGVPAPGWEYVYQLTAILQDFAGDMDMLSRAIVEWVAIEQPDLLKNLEANKRGIRFETELMTDELADILVEIDLTEAVYVIGDAFDHPTEPPADPTSRWLYER